MACKSTKMLRIVVVRWEAAVHSWRPGLSRLFLLSIAFAFGMVANVAPAAQTTFSFTATVTDISSSSGVESLLPFAPMVGQNMAGLVTFTPVPFSQMSGNDATLHVLWQGETFTANNLLLATENDVFVAVGMDVQGPFDSLSVSCGINGICPVTSTSLLDLAVDYLGIGLGQGSDVIPTSLLIDTPATWNALQSRSLVLTLSSMGFSPPLTIYASVGPMNLVPEPSMGLLLLFSGALFAGIRAAHRSFRR